MGEAAVRVSRESKIVLNTVRAIRAITLAEVRAILSTRQIDFVIFEAVEPEEAEAIKELKSEFRMPMYTFGPLQIEGVQNCTSLSDLQDLIEGDTGIVVKTYANIRTPKLWEIIFDEYGNEVKQGSLSGAGAVLGIEMGAQDSGTETVTQDIVEQSVEQSVAETAEQPAETVTHEPVEQPAETVTQEPVEQPAETVTQEITEQPDIETVTHEPVEQPDAEQGDTSTSEDLTADSVEEPIENIDDSNTSVSAPEINIENDFFKSAVFNGDTELPSPESFTQEFISKLRDNNITINGDSVLYLALVTELSYYRKIIKQLQSSPVNAQVADLYEKLSSAGDGSDNSELREEYDRLVAESNEKNELIQSIQQRVDMLTASLEEANTKTEQLSSELATANTKTEQLSSELATAQTEKAEVDSRLESLLAELRDAKEFGSSSNETLSKLQNDYEEVKAKLDESTNNNEDLKSKFGRATELVTDYEQQLDKQRNLTTRLLMKIVSLEEQLDTEYQKNSVAMNQYRELLATKAEADNQVAELQRSLSDNQRRASRQEADYKRRVTDLSSAKDKLSQQLSEAEVLKTELTLKVETLSQQLEHANLEKEGAQNAQYELEDELRTLQEQLNESNRTITELSEKIEELKVVSSDAINTKDKLSISDATVTELQKEIGRLQLSLRETQRIVDLKDKKIGELNSQLSNVSRSAAVAERARSVGSNVVLECRYTGRAYIIPVFGGGSYGITTTAVSIAKKIFKEGNSNVCLLDMDLVSPKINAFFTSAKPLVGYREEGLDPIYSSCMGLLMIKGSSWFLDHRSEFVQTVETVKKTGRRLDYFSGLQAPVEASKFISIDYTELLSTIGNDYDYIIVDLGKIGANNTQDALIRMFNSISLRTAVVSLKDNDSLRNIIVKTTLIKLDKKKLVWLLNMGQNTGINEFIERTFKTMPYRIMTFNNGFFNEHKVFGTVLLKGVFDEFVDDLILGGER